MKEYQKPELEIVSLMADESITSEDPIPFSLDVSMGLGSADELYGLS